MPTFDYAAMQTLSTGLLEKFTQGAASLVQITPGGGPGYNPGPSIETVIPLNGVAKGVSSQYIIGGLANAGDLQLTVAVVPGVKVNQTTDKIQLPDGSRWKIVQDLTVPAMGTPVVWKFIIRK